MSDDSISAVRDQYGVAVEDERHYRSAYQTRLSYHTNVVLVSAAAIVAGLARMQTVVGVMLLGTAMMVVGGFAILTPLALRRLYTHFLEHLDARERLEVLLGIRGPSGIAGETTVAARIGGAKPTPALPPMERRFLSEPLFTHSWVGNSRKGYFGWMELGFRVAGTVMVFLGLAVVYWSDAIAANSRTDLRRAVDDQPGQAIYVSLDIPIVIGPFGLGESCFTDTILIAQVDSALALMRRLSASELTLVGSVDAVPVNPTSSQLRTNAGLASARARCVAGWMIARDAEGMRAIRMSLQVEDGGVRSASGSPEHRRVSVRVVSRRLPVEAPTTVELNGR
jgi:hypothetical protein